MQVITSPIVMWRNRYGVTQATLAKRLGLSRPQLSKLEAGCYATLPANVSAELNLTDETYQRFKALKRKALDLSTEAPLSPFVSPAAFKAWRELVAWNKFLAPGVGAFASAVATNVGYLKLFESRSQGQLPPAVWDVLLACGLKVDAPALVGQSG